MKSAMLVKEIYMKIVSKEKKLKGKTKHLLTAFAGKCILPTVV